MHIEVIAIAVPLCVFAGLMLISKLTLKINQWRYKPENDKGRPFTRTSRTIDEAELSFTGSTEPEQRELLQIPTSDRDGTVETSDRETNTSPVSRGSRIRRKFRRRAKK